MAPTPRSAATDNSAQTFDADACVVGAGPAGLAAGKAMADRGITFDWFEKGSMVGGLWRIDNDNDDSAAYETLHLNSSRPLTQYPSYPMPEHWPDFPHHTLMAQYFQKFAEDNGLVERITFRSPVTRIEPLPGDGLPGRQGWAVTTDGGRTRTYRSVSVATGHHGVPKQPQFAGSFSGRSLHAHEYVEPSMFEGRDVLVVGVGNSGMDISCEASRVARNVYLSTRHGVHVIPKYAFGRPIDQFTSPLFAYIPFPVERKLYEMLIRLSTGRPQDRGLPKPDHRLLSAHPTVSSELYDRVGHGDITIKPDVDRLDGDSVRFVDGSREHVDVVVYATGYRVSLPFLAPDVYDPAGNSMPLYQRVLTPDRPGLFFIGFIQTVGSNISLVELQSDWVGDLITGASQLPSDAEMRDWIATDQAALAHRYVRSERHTMQVDFWRYRRALKEARSRKKNPTLVERLTRPLLGLR
ncbi:flavin-containing monooxygenase [Rhodococcus sp. W8901]|uniref:flavin-containing monooxygenase n=1 Tax=Rhodococcus sp. W8901 TaxID=2742603 RepID=UPI001582867F|nr:NAD(P)-binding domain-containing protein [Rhodococcus sp. W8901]QKT12983.1 NAD(P)-binding domain-containing protein [Rhodococcus sp. W8901]